MTPALYYCGSEVQHCNKENTQEERKKCRMLHFQILATEQKHSGRDKAKTKTPWLHFQILATEQKHSERDKRTTKTHCHLLHFQILATDHQLVFVLLYASVQCWDSVDLLNLSQFWRPRISFLDHSLDSHSETKI